MVFVDISMCGPWPRPRSGRRRQTVEFPTPLYPTPISVVSSLNKSDSSQTVTALYNLLTVKLSSERKYHDRLRSNTRVASKVRELKN